MPLDDAFLNKYRYCSRHFVVMTWFDQSIQSLPEDDWRYLAVSGFVMSFEDQWYLATAGHILAGIETNRSRNLTRVRSFGLIDHGGVEAKHTDSIPFNYVDAIKFFVEDNDAGLDFGFVELSPFYRRLLEANSVAPITEQHWDRPDDTEYSEYVVLGCPTARQGRVGGIKGADVTLQGHAQIVIMPLERLSGDMGLPPKTNPVFYGRMRDAKVNDIDGFSGGPLVGLRTKQQNGTIPYRVLAMQYAWHRDKRITLACPLQVFAPLFQKHRAAARTT